MAELAPGARGWRGPDLVGIFNRRLRRGGNNGEGMKMQEYIAAVRNNFWPLAFGIWMLGTWFGLSLIRDQIRSSTDKIVRAINELELAMKPRDRDHFHWHEPEK